VLSLAILVVILMRALEPMSNPIASVSTNQGGVSGSISTWSRTVAPAVHVDLDSVVAPWQRDWLAAIRHAGTNVTWSGPHIAATAATLNPLPDPVGTSELAISAPARSTVVVGDRMGPIDSVAAGANGARIEIPGNLDALHVSVRGSTARVVAPDSIAYKRLLVEGAAGWETKFTIAALTERGWKVDALVHVAPGVDVRTGTPVAPDTSRYAAVVAVDSTATMIGHTVASYVQSGGGLVTLRDASGVGPREATSVLLARQADGEIRASRVGSGRVIRVGSNDLWRRRMTGDDTVPNPVVAHRALLARIVAAVAYAPRIARESDSPTDVAPLADMIDRLGAASPPIEARSLDREVPSSILFGVLLLSLLLELASRRFRGAR
jgi:hypothetical protein